MTSKRKSHEELSKMANYIVGRHNNTDKQELFQIVYLAGMEADEKGSNVFGAMKKAASHRVVTQYSPVEVPDSGANHTAIAKLKRGKQPETASELRMASVLGSQDDILPITVITTENPESILMHKEVMETLRVYLDHSSLYLTEQQRDAIGVVYFGEPLPEDFMTYYGTGPEGIRWHSSQGIQKIRKSLNVTERKN